MVDKKAEAEAKKQEKKTRSESTDMQVKVYAPFKIYFNGRARSITAVNDTGVFDILPQHHNFMTLVNACDVIVRTEKSEEKIPIKQGIMHVKADEVVLFLDV